MLYQQIKDDRMKHLGKDRVAFAILGLVISEIQRSTLSDDVPDETVVKVIKKLLQGIEESLLEFCKHNEKSSEKAINLIKERDTLNSYLPKQLSTEELTEIMKNAATEYPEYKTNKGAMFKFLKSNYGSLYDGKSANEIYGKLW